MTTDEAKLHLAGYRPELYADNDEQIAEALEMAKADPELGAWLEAEIEFDPSLLIPADIDVPDRETEVQLLWDAIDRVLSLPHPPSVICFGNDRMAMRAYGILRSRGLELPKDISVAGFDNYRLITESLYPSLMSAELPYAAIGIRATQTLLDLLSDGSAAPDQPILITGPVAPGDSVLDVPTPITQLSTVGRKTT